MTVGGTRVPREGWYSSMMAVGEIFAAGSMEGGSLGMGDDEGGGGAEAPHGSTRSTVPPSRPRQVLAAFSVLWQWPQGVRSGPFSA